MGRSMLKLLFEPILTVWKTGTALELDASTCHSFYGQTCVIHVWQRCSLWWSQFHGVSSVSARYCVMNGCWSNDRWLGQNSKQNKLMRQLGDVQVRMRLKVSGDKSEIRQSYIPELYPHIVQPLVEEGAVSYHSLTDVVPVTNAFRYRVPLRKL